MDASVFLAVLAAALLHAGWNALVKTGLDRFTGVIALSTGQAALALPLLPFVPMPAPEAWGFVAASALLHMGYKIGLIGAYRHGDLSQVYPVARGSAPLLVMLVSVSVLDEQISAAAVAGVLAVSAGVLLMALRGGGLVRLNRAALGFALLTALFTAGYTLVDGLGARAAGTASGYILWMILGDTVGMVAYGIWRRGQGILGDLGRAWRPGLLTGVMSVTSYWIAIWAFTQAPIALVAALRETSILFAVLIGTLLLRESAGGARWLAAASIVAGVVLIRL